MVKERPPEGYPEPIIEPGSELDPFRPATEEEIAAAIEHRDRLVQQSNVGARISPQEAELLHSIRMEDHARQVLSQGYALENEVIAYALIKQGRYKEALEYPSKHDDEARALIEARALPDDARCDCPDVQYQETIGNRTTTKTTCSESVISTPWLPILGTFGYLFRCATCGFQNLVATLPPEIADAHSGRMAAMSDHKGWLPK